MTYTPKELEEAAAMLRQAELENEYDRGYWKGHEEGYKTGQSAKFPRLEVIFVVAMFTLAIGILLSFIVGAFLSI